MRLFVLLTCLLASPGLCQTKPLTVENISWERCLRMLDGYGRAFAERGWGRGQKIEGDGSAARALVTGSEIIIMECRGDPATFTRRVARM
ncbi:MAG: hypothetical protein AAFV96_02705 [Pseudomonadota bacterium]